MSPALPPMEASKTALGGYISGDGQGEWPCQKFARLFFGGLLGRWGSGLITTSNMLFGWLEKPGEKLREASPISQRHRREEYPEFVYRKSGTHLLTVRLFGIPELALALVDPSATCMHPMRPSRHQRPR